MKHDNVRSLNRFQYGRLILWVRESLIHYSGSIHSILIIQGNEDRNSNQTEDKNEKVEKEKNEDNILIQKLMELVEKISERLIIIETLETKDT